MKTIFTYFFLFFFSVSCLAQWEPINTGVITNSFNDVAFLSTEDIIVVGSGGTIIKSYNGGITWVEKNSGTTASLWRTQFPTAQIGYIIASDGNLLKTTDGGETWTPKETGLSGSGLSNFNLSCVNENLIFVANRKSEDGGENWTELAATPIASKIQYLNSNIGFAGKNLWEQSDWQHPQFFKTTNGGNSWQSLSGVAPFHFLNENTGFYYSGGLYKTSNGAESFEKLNDYSSYQYSLREIFAVNENTVWGLVWLAILDGDTSTRGIIKVFLNNDGEYTQQTLYDSNPDLDFNSIKFVNENLGFAVGTSSNQGIVWRNGNGLNQTMGTQDSENVEFKIYPNPSTTEININFKKRLKENFNVIITDVTGKQIFSKQFSNEQNIKINTSKYSKGNYILSISTEQKKISQKIIIN